ncbi:AAA family ATPase [Iningainema tapete]|uniref:AAA family ATPase n=1 Tax=Iningainema tapete BLCC-T55 TaxID=2748662 RepID=A0A8J6XQS5_9CYAN|nr:AAA family ATPase [Iningainema tapete]MBD2771793.1 AAA family ATPase [Iningainema tapete BLCC-T55]
MTNSEDVAIANEQSLQTLNRAIRLSQGQFSLILVRCNYADLRQQMAQRLHQLSSLKISEITLPASVKTLYTTILAELGDEQPNAVMVFGLESVKDLDTVLTSANFVREEFRKNFSFPLLLWVNDQVLQKLIRLATDFENWATTIGFKSSSDELVNFLRKKTDEIFAGNTNPNPEICWQLQTALRDLQNREQVLDADIQASLEFVIGLHEYQLNRPESALQHYQHSLSFWQQQLLEPVSGGDGEWGREGVEEMGEELRAMHSGWSNTSYKGRGNFGTFYPEQDSGFKVSILSVFTTNMMETPHRGVSTEYTQQFLERQGVLLLHIGLVYCRKAEQNLLENIRFWQESRYYLQQCLDTFAQANRLDLVAQHITKLCEVLQYLEEWDTLQSVVEQSLKLHHKHGSQLQVAQAYGFLAEVALAQSSWDEAQQLAQKTLRILANIHNLKSHYFGKYRLILAQAQQSLGEIKEAVLNLKRARNESNPQCEPVVYIRILEKLRSLYFDNGEYLKAFEIKQEQISIEYQYGLRAFIGAAHLHPQQYSIINAAQLQAEHQAIVAQEIAASGRQQDINRLLERISRNDHKLIVIHGQSGVGKSSILKAGLLPALKQQSIGERDALPVLLRVYRDWVKTLARCLTDNVETRNFASLQQVDDILQQLRQNANCNLLTVLIFDQFEEFFFEYPEQNQRRQFYEFLRDCLNIPYLKIILSLREDYLHYLLEWERLINLDVINNNILDKNIRYYLGNFSPQDAKAVIESLTERTHLYLEPALVDKLVEDLACFGEIRPIELQIVGAQLQTDKITTLEKYHQIGNKEKLVEHFLEAAIQDCGAPNERAARLVLYLLTDENGTRPLKTNSELVADLEALDLAVEIDNLDLVLQVLVGAGLVFLVPEACAKRYQLIHDYLVRFIRQQQAPALWAELAAAKEQQKQTEEQLRDTLKQLEKALHKEQEERKRAEVAEMEALVSLSQALFLSHDQLGGLLAAVKALKQLQEAELTPATQLNIVNRIHQAVSEVQECNRLEGHTNSVTSVNFSRDRERIVSAAQRTIKIWSTDGTLLETIQAHRGIVWDVVFSPDGKLIASASDDTTVKLWTRDGKLLKTLSGHSDQVFSVAFSPDSKTIVSASGDRTIKLWSRDGRLLKTLSGHSKPVLSVCFSPDGEIIASGSTDETVRLWTKNGELWTKDGTFLKTLCGHSFGVNSVKFSPDGRIIASASSDNTIKLWSKNGTLLRTLQGHTNGVNCIRFSPDSRTIVSASLDSTIKFWSKDGQVLCTLQGHRAGVNYVSVSPDGKTIASASGDRTIKLWRKQGIKLQGSDVNELLVQGCDWLRDYLKTNPNVTKSDKYLCD